jgi:maltose O-acetyltransferase
MAPTANIERGAFVGSGTHISIGHRSSIGVNASIHGPLSIGANVMMGPDVRIYALSHSTASSEIPMIDQGFDEPRPVIIEDDVWIGARAIVLPGVQIGRSSIIGAGAVVTKSVPAFSLAAGNPARVVRHR